MGTLPFVGRGGQFAELSAALADARAGHGGLALLLGPAGAGKTRIATELVHRTTDFRTGWAGGPPPGEGDAFWPWSQVLRELVTADTATVSPALRRVAAGQPARAGTRDPEGARLRLSAEVTDVLRAASVTLPLLIVLDDLHDADTSSLRLLRDVIRALGTAPVLIVAT